MKTYQVTQVTDPYDAGLSITHHYFSTKKEAEQFVKDNIPGDIVGEINGTVAYMDDDNTRHYFKIENILKEMPGTIEVETKAGTLRAHKCTDPGNPGIVLMLEPEGFDFEIDVAMAEVHENDQEGGDQDVNVYVWSNVYSEDWTLHATLKRNDTVKALNTDEETYEINFRDGHTLQYLTYCTKAENFEDAMSKFYDAHGRNFDHKIESVLRNGKPFLQPNVLS